MFNYQFGSCTGSATLPPDDDNFGFVWSELASALVNVGGSVYTASEAKKMEEKRLSTDTAIAAMREQTERMKIELQQKQAELLAKANEKPSMISGSAPATASMVSMGNPKTILILAGVAGVVGLSVYLMSRK